MWSKSSFCQFCHLSPPQLHLCLAAKQMPQSMAVSTEPWAGEWKQIPVWARPIFIVAPNPVHSRHRTFLSCVLFLLSPARYLFPRPRSRIENVLISYSCSVKEVKPSSLTGLMCGATAQVFSVSTFYFCKQKEGLKLKLALFLSIRKAFSFTFLNKT